MSGFSVNPFAAVSTSELAYEMNAINDLIRQPDIVSYEMLQDNSVRLPKIEIATIAAGKFNADGSTVKAKNITVENTEEGKYRATFSAPRPDCDYQVNIQLHQNSVTLDDFGVYVVTTVCENSYFEYYIIESDNGRRAGNLKNLEHTITVTDFL